MNDQIKTLGARLRRDLESVVSEPIGWSLIDALCRLEEEETSGSSAGKNGLPLAAGDREADGPKEGP